MSISVKNIRVSIDGVQSTGFDIVIGGVMFRMDDFSLVQSLLSPNQLSFSLHKEPDEDIQEAQFLACGEIIGKEIELGLDTDNIEAISLKAEADKTAEITFKGVIVSTSGSRSRTRYTIMVQAIGWDGLLDDNPNCKSFENMTLDEIIGNVTDDYSSQLDTRVQSRFKEIIPYCVQYNETNYAFLQRLARRYGEWMYNDGNQLVFGELSPGETVRLIYPSHDIPDYSVEMKMKPVAFSHVASSYNEYNSSLKQGLEEMQRPYNHLGDKVFEASQSRFLKPTLQNLHSGGYADEDSRATILDVSTKTQARGEKAGMLTYSGTTYCSKLKIGSTLVIVDNYLIQGHLSNEKSEVEQDEILIVELSHFFSENETYQNHFWGISSACDYPPYADTDVIPRCPSSRAKVTDNEDPKGLGRVRVQFDWQAQQDDEMMTPWLRIVHPYAGGGKGFSFIPEIGEEVMVDFEGGNAERPYVKGTVYNGPENPDGAWLPNQNQANPIKAIRTRNGHTIEIHDEGEDGYIRIYDNGKENYILTFSTDQKLIKLESTGNIELYAKKDIIMHAGHDMNIKVGNNRTLEVGKNDAASVGNDQSLRVGNDQEVTINNNNTVKIGGDQMVDISGNKDERVVNSDFLSAKEYREEIEKEVIVLAESQQYKSTRFTKIDGGTQVDIKASIAKVN